MRHHIGTFTCFPVTIDGQGFHIIAEFKDGLNKHGIHLPKQPGEVHHVQVVIVLNGTYRPENCCTEFYSAPETAQFPRGSFEFEDLKAIDYWAIGTIITELAGYIKWNPAKWNPTKWTAFYSLHVMMGNSWTVW